MARKRDLARRSKATGPAFPKSGKATKAKGRANAPAAVTRQAKPTKPSPRSQTLPGMSAIRSKPLDNLCEGIGDCRTTKNAATVEEAGYTRSALKVMQQRGLSVYKHAGVELALVPGSDKLRVRLTTEKGDAAVSAGTDAPGQPLAGQSSPRDTAEEIEGEGFDGVGDEAGGGDEETIQ